MNGAAITFAGAELIALACGALYWPERRLLAAADLHLGKSARMARRGGALLPPYETAETLRRLEAALAETDPAIVIALGDSFDDVQAASEIAAPDRARLAALAQGRRWIWIAGNHDPMGVREHRAGGLLFRHMAEKEGPLISGHFHPKARLAGQARPCFLVGARHLILPAFGAYTGGLDCRAPPLRALAPEGLMVLTGRRAITAPLHP